jgi:transposase-like protein
MKISNGSSRRRWRRIGADQRAQLLAAFDRSGMSAAAFARQHGLYYTTFCGWRQRRAAAKPSPGFVQVELPTPAAPVELVIDLNAQARLRISSAGQIELAVRLLQALNAKTAC